MEGINYITTHRRIATMLERLNEELSSTIEELVEEAKKGNDDDTLEFLENNNYLTSEDDEYGETLVGINLKTGKVVYDYSGSTNEYELAELNQQRRLDILEALAKGAYTTYKEGAE